MRTKILIGILLLALGAAIGYFFSKYLFFDLRQKPLVAPSSGEESEQRPILPPFAVVIENAPEARPQSGLLEGDVVFETLTEGGITRYLAIFQNRRAERIGPVRSLRPYFLEWALGFGLPVAFSGGSKEALEKLSDQSLGAKAINEFFNERAFWRDPATSVPHNLFTSTKLLVDTFEQKDWGEPSPFVRGWDVKAKQSLASPVAVSEIFIDFSFEPFEVNYQFDSASNSYLRFLGNKPHLDQASGEQLRADNVVVLSTTSRLLDQKLLTIDLETLGSGRATIFRDGQVLQARWRKNSAAEPLRLVDADGTLVALNEGAIWIAVVDQSGNASWK